MVHDPFEPEVDATTAQSERARQLTALEVSDLLWLMGSKRGRRIVWRLLEEAGVFRTSFNTNSLLMAFAEGTRNYGLRVLGLIHTHCPELYAPMLKEQRDQEPQND
jgi:hypothetical protein